MKFSSDTPVKPPFFILGSQRSGTTMLRLMLNCHPNIAIPHETAFITIFCRKLTQYGDIRDKDVRRRMLADIMEHKLVKRGELVSKDDFDAIIDQPTKTYSDFVNSIMTFYALRFGKKYWGDKTPFYSKDVDLLYSIFPDCKIVHIVRDPRDVILSQMSMEWMSNSVVRLAEDWKWTGTLLSKVGTVLGENYMRVRYEDLVLDSRSTLEALCNYLTEPFDPSMLEYENSSLSVVPQHSLRWHSNSVKSPQSEKIGQWRKRMRKSDICIIEEITGDLMKEFNYELANYDPGLRTKLRKLYFALVRRW